MYGGGWIGKNVVVIDKEYGEIEGILGPSRTLPSLVGKTGKCIDAYDDQYDTSYPTGYERITLIIETDGGEIQVDSACVKQL